MGHILANIITICILAFVVIGISVYLYKTKRQAKGCAGCPYCNLCSGGCESGKTE